MKHGRSSARRRASRALDYLARELVNPILDLDGVDDVWVLHPKDAETSAHVWVRVSEGQERVAWTVDGILRPRLDDLEIELKERGLDLDASVMLDDGCGHLRPLRVGASGPRH